MIISGLEDLFGFGGVDSVRKLQREVDRIFSRGIPAESYEYPPLNIYAEGEDVIITSELPGIDAKELDISVVGKVLTIKGERRAEPLAEGEKYLRRERPAGSFSRSLELPYVVDSDQVEATYKKGVLTVKLPRAERDRPKKITVN